MLFRRTAYARRTRRSRLAHPAAGPVWLAGLATLRVKECDRIAAPAAELRKLGIPVVEGEDWIEISEHRAEAQGLSVNRWLNLAIAHALSGEHAIEITETTTMKAVL